MFKINSMLTFVKTWGLIKPHKRVNNGKVVLEPANMNSILSLNHSVLNFYPKMPLDNYFNYAKNMHVQGNKF